MNGTPKEREVIADEQCRRDGIRRIDPIQMHRERWSVLEDVPSDLRHRQWHRVQPSQ